MGATGSVAANQNRPGFDPFEPGHVGLPLGALPAASVVDGSLGAAQCASSTMDDEESRSGVYAIVRSGGRQHKVAVGDVVEIDKIVAKAGEVVKLTPLLLVDGDDVMTSTDKLTKVAVTAEVIGETKGPKIRIIKFKNKTGYKKRQGHRQRYTQVKVTGIK